jgi:hypothetical protein
MSLKSVYERNCYVPGFYIAMENLMRRTLQRRDQS